MDFSLSGAPFFFPHYIFLYDRLLVIGPTVSPRKRHSEDLPAITNDFLFHLQLFLCGFFIEGLKNHMSLKMEEKKRHFPPLALYKKTTMGLFFYGPKVGNCLRIDSIRPQHQEKTIEESRLWSFISFWILLSSFPMAMRRPSFFFSHTFLFPLAFLFPFWKEKNAKGKKDVGKEKRPAAAQEYFLFLDLHHLLFGHFVSFK